MPSRDAILALIGAAAGDLGGSMKQNKAQRGSAEAALRKLAMDAERHQAELGKLDAETRKLLQPPQDPRPPQTLNPGQGLRQPDGSYSVPVPDAGRAPQGPVRGSPEYLKAFEEEERIRSRYRPTPAAKTALPSESERKNAALLMSGEQGYNTLRNLLANGKQAPSWKDTQLAKVGMGAGNMLTSSEYRQMRQGALQLADAWLRFTTGASAPETEVERTAQTFIPQAGDDDGTLLQKSRSRETIIRALRQGAGRAAPQQAADDYDVPNGRDEDG